MSNNRHDELTSTPYSVLAGENNIRGAMRTDNGLDCVAHADHDQRSGLEDYQRG